MTLLLNIWKLIW